MTWEIIQGDAKTSLTALDAESVHTCVTSPPYWGLRDYGVEHSIWDNHNGCEHEWERYLQPSANGQTSHAMIAETLNESSATRKPKVSAFCSCGAWRGAFGLEPTPELYVKHLVETFREVKRVLRPDGTLWLNLGDSYAGYWGDKTAKREGRRSSADTNGWTNDFNMNARPDFHTAFDSSGIKPKDLVGIPWMAAFALRADGWYLRSDIVWSKPNPMPESVRDRPTKAHEYIFLLSKSQRYYYDTDAIREPANYDGRKDEVAKGTPKYVNGAMPNGQPHTFSRAGTPRWVKTASGERVRNKRSVWTVTTKPYREAHFATFPPDLIEPCILAGAPVGGTVLDPFAGSGTTGAVAVKHQRNFVGIELNPAYIGMAQRRIGNAAPLFESVA